MRKTAEQRVNEIAADLIYGLSGEQREGIRRHMLEFARDQRHACVEALNSAYLEAGEDQGDTVDPQAVVMNTPFPGE